MTTALGDMYAAYADFLDRNVDERMREYPFVSSPIPVILIIVAYNYFISDYGPKMMKDRPPFQLKKIMILYNAIQVMVNGYIICVGTANIWMSGEYGWRCTSVDTSYSPTAKVLRKLAYLYSVNKFMDLTDTIFMVLRKKTNQISFLHQYHHIGMCIAAWICCAFAPGGSHVILFGTVNCVVHTIMYSYYLVTIIYPEYRHSSYKRRITELQLLQFVIVFLHAVSGLVDPQCDFPMWGFALFIPQDVFMFALFWDFYYKTYLKPQAKQTGPKKQETQEISAAKSKKVS